MAIPSHRLPLPGHRIQNSTHVPSIRTILALAAVLSLSVTLAGLRRLDDGGSDDGGGGEAGSDEAAAERGSITVWYSNDEQEVTWARRWCSVELARTR